MTKLKKILLSLVAFVGVALASVISFIGLNEKVALGGGALKNSGETATPSNTEVSTNVDTITTPNTKPSTITYEADTISIQKGGSKLNYTYSPSVNAKDASSVVAYEYVFGNSMEITTAVNLKTIDTTSVNISYAYSTTKLNTSNEITGETNYTLQKLENKGSKVYIYVIVSPTDEAIPTTFTTSIVWYYGIPTTIYVNNNVDNTITTQTIVGRQKIYENTLSEPEAPSGYEFEGWYLDEDFTQPVTYPFTMEGKKLYASFIETANLPSDWLAYDTSSSSYYVKKGTSTLPNKLIIPETYDDGTNGEASVTYIYNAAFSSDGVFYNQTSLTSVNLPSTITSIGNGAFFNCYHLTNINLEQCVNLTSVETYAFNACYSLTSITIPASVTSIGSYTFTNSVNLYEVYNLSSLNITAGSADNGYAGDNAKVVHTSLDEASILTTIGGVVYYMESTTSYEALTLFDKTLTDVTLDARTTVLSNYIFYNCTSLVSVDLSECATTLTSMLGKVFYGCSNLTNVDLSKCTKLLNIGSDAFEGCSSLTNISIPSTVRTIGDYAFKACSSLTSITMPSSLRSIGTSAFQDCSDLTSVDFSNCTKLTTIGMYAFEYCGSLTGVDLSNCTNLTTMGRSVFNSCTTLTSLSLPSSLTTIEYGAFGYCYALKRADLSNCTNLTTIEDIAFRYCITLTTVKLPSSVTNIGQEVFENCTKLTSISIEGASTSTWYATTSSDYTGGEVVALSDTSANATYFGTTYVSYYWYKV